MPEEKVKEALQTALDKSDQFKEVIVIASVKDVEEGFIKLWHNSSEMSMDIWKAMILNHMQSVGVTVLQPKNEESKEVK